MTEPDEAPQSIHEKDVKVSASGLRYYVPGEGGNEEAAPVLLLHPWFGCAAFWEATVQALPQYRYYVVDQYSLGDTDWRDLRGPKGMAQALLGLLDELNVPMCDLVGNSAGGITGQFLASKWPDRVSKLVLVGTGARFSGLKPEFAERLYGWMRTTELGESDLLTEMLVDSVLARRPQSPHVWDSYVAAVRGADRRFMVDFVEHASRLDLRPLLPSITAETLIIRGELDAARTLVHVQELLDGIPHSAYVEIEGGGHSPMVDSPVAFTSALGAFLSGEVVAGQRSSAATY